MGLMEAQAGKTTLMWEGSPETAEWLLTNRNFTPCTILPKTSNEDGNTGKRLHCAEFDKQIYAY